MRGVVVADFAGRGDEQVIVISEEDDYQLYGVSLDREEHVLFDPIASLPAGEYSFSGADVDGDRRLDLVAAGLGQTSRSVILSGSTDGGFSQPQALDGVSGAKDRLFVDMNGDGRLDLLSLAEDGVWVAEALGDAQFAGAYKWTQVAGTRLIATDLERDGRPDLVVAGPGRRPVWVRRGGEGSATDVRLLLDVPATAVAAVDLERDGIDEIVVASTQGEGLNMLDVGHWSAAGRRSFSAWRWWGARSARSAGSPAVGVPRLC
nr:VCBS repeat-containing protein [Nannocystis pusilla]